MVQTSAKTRNYAIIAIVLFIAIIAVGANSNPVWADACMAQLSYPVMPSVYSYSSVPIVVPISATCTTVFGNQIYVTGNAYDATSNVGLGSVNTVLQSANGGTTFSGQLGFTLPPTTQDHTVTISASIYASQYGSLITSTSETFQAVSGNQQVSTTTVTQYPYQYPNQYPSQYPTQYPYQSSYPYQTPPYQQPSQQRPYRNQSQYQTLNQNNSSLLGYVAIAAILATVIIATAGLVVYGRRQQPPSITWVPPPPPPR
ncbi:MAG: hypothetical protein ABSD99_02400 [Candidatus Bathyarchaeia archaeon]